MPTELPVDTGGTDYGKKLWDKHQADEFTHVDHYKEAICINCFSKDASAATIVAFSISKFLFFIEGGAFFKIFLR